MSSLNHQGDIPPSFGRPPIANSLKSVQLSGASPATWPYVDGVSPAGLKARPDQPFLRGRWVQVAYALIDVCFILFNFAIVFALRFPGVSFRELLLFGRYPSIANHYGGFLLLDVCLTLMYCHGEELYRTPLDRSAVDESVAVAKAVAFATLLLTAFMYLSGITIVSRIVVIVSAALNVATLSLWRYAKRRLVLHRAESGIGARNALIIGAGRVGQALAEQFEANKLLGYRFVGFLDGNHSTDPRRLGNVDDLLNVVRAEYIDEVFITIPSEREMVKWVVHEAQQQRLSVNVIPDLYDGIGWDAPLHRIGEFPVMDLHWQPIPTAGLLIKRIVDVVLSAIGLVLCVPLFILIGIAIWADSPGPIFYRAPRAGRKGRPFRCCKFRTMIANADKLKDSLRKRNERRGPLFKITNDPRITRLGKFLRKYSLDELPQLWNVLVGDMSLVGPRPHPLDDYSKYNLDHRRRLEVKPGVTGLWQVTARRDPSFETNMRLDLQYIENWDLRLDFEILLRTFSAVLRAEGC
jgi:exopolysaccharide biosynthesis polyprenyl glycosylphosphotransferase